jgi:penicillin-binding protein 2
MFERRLKIFLGALAAMSILLVARAGQVQIVEREKWRRVAVESMRRPLLVDTIRGSIYDVKGRLIATDQPCTDVCVDYRALTDPPDEAWVADRAAERVHNRLSDDYAKAPKKVRKELLGEEESAVRADVKHMWALLAQVSGKPPEEIDEARAAIIRRVEMRRKLVWYRNYAKAREKSEQNKKPESESIWRRWLIEEDEPAGPDLDNYSVTVAEQNEPHVILRAVPDLQQIELGKHMEHLPGLVLRPSTHRVYPFGSAFCHGMGHVGHVNHEDLINDPNPRDDTRQYLPNDLIGRAGVEGLCDQALRGAKGKIVRVLGSDVPVSTTPAIPGSDVRLSIDIELQAAIEDVFTHADIIDEKDQHEIASLHGAAVVIDVPTGEVRALASYPTYDLNRFDEAYQDLYNDQLNNALFNRATMSQLQPGSTVKPMVGISAITQGLATPQEGIECTGFLVIDGKRRSVGRCWVESKFGPQLRALGMTSAHHPVPSGAPHPTGFLTFGDALERSCNVYFETMASRLGMEGLSIWFDRFGLGRATGIGIPEAHGRLPRDYQGPLWDRQYKTWFSGIGQDPVAATPIQMANIAATIARDGIWMRPRLLPDPEALELGIRPAEPLPPGAAPGTAPTYYPDRVDLNLSRAALAAAKDGMQRVVRGKAGTGKGVLRGASKQLEAIPLCCKTGTAQAPRFGIKLRDEHGKPLLDEHGRQRYDYIDPSTADHPSTIAPWYRGNGPDGRDINHAWYIGFAPAERPQVAFAVMIEYGGSGGMAAAAVARSVLESCIGHGYLAP